MLGNRYLSGKKGFLGCKRHFNMKYSPGREGPRQGCKDQEEEEAAWGCRRTGVASKVGLGGPIAVPDVNLRGAGFWFLGAVTK
jgi:hypothetical protein